jgi:hypothetical protein
MDIVFIACLAALWGLMALLVKGLARIGASRGSRA